MPQCKDCINFMVSEDGREAFCRGHLASLQKADPDEDAGNCPINKFENKE